MHSHQVFLWNRKHLHHPTDKSHQKKTLISINISLCFKFLECTFFSLNFMSIEYSWKIMSHTWRVFSFVIFSITCMFTIQYYVKVTLTSFRTVTTELIIFIVNNSKQRQLQTTNRWKVWQLHKWDFEEGNLAAEDSSDIESDAVEGWWTKSNKKLLNLKMRHVGNYNK